MSITYPGSLITKTPVTPVDGVASGIWTLSEQAYWQAQNAWTAQPDPNFENVTLLLNGDGTNGAQNNTFLDSSTNNFTITRNGNTTQGSFSPYGSLWSNYFNGGSSIGFTNSSSFNLSSSNWTIEAWIFPTATGSYPVIAGVYSDTITNASFFWSLGNGNTNLELYLYVGSGSTPFVATNAVTLNAWNHVAAVRNGNTVIQYVNGVQVSSTSFTQTINNSTQQFTVGNVPSSTNYFYNGYVSNVRYVVGTAVYTSAFTPSTTPLTAITNTQLLTCQSNRFIDNSSNNLAFASSSGSPSVQRFSPFNPTASYSTSVIGGSGYFDGSGDYLSTSSNANLAIGSNDFCIETWFNTSSTSEQTFFGQWENATSKDWIFQYRTSPNEIRFYYNSSSELVGSFTLVLNQWNHIVVCRSGSTMSLYANGVRLATKTDSTSINNGTGLNIGRNADNLQYVTGYIDDCRLVVGSSVYTPSSSTLTVPTAPLTAITNTKFLANFTNAGIPDLAMQNNLETVGNAQVSTSVKKYGTGSLAFDGTGDYLLSAATQVIAASRFTVEAWLYKSSTNEKYAIAQGTSGNAGRFAIGVAGTNWFVQIGSANVNAGSVSTNTWTHIAVTYDGATLTLYVNGTSVGTASTTQAVQNTTLRLGTLGPSWSDIYEWDGYMDDIRITNGVIRYTTTFTPPASAFPKF